MLKSFQVWAQRINNFSLNSNSWEKEFVRFVFHLLPVILHILKFVFTGVDVNMGMLVMEQYVMEIL